MERTKIARMITNEACAIRAGCCTCARIAMARTSKNAILTRTNATMSVDVDSTEEENCLFALWSAIENSGARRIG